MPSKDTETLASNSLGGSSRDEANLSTGDADKGAREASPASNASSGHRAVRRRRLLLGVAAVLVLGAVVVFGIPWVRRSLNTVSTDDAFVNGHVTFVAPRVPGQVSKVLVDANNRVRK